MGKAITLRGSVDSETGETLTILDGQGLQLLVLQCLSGEGPNTVFDGLLIQNGAGMYNYNSSPTLTNCTFTNNSADGRRRDVQLQQLPHPHQLHVHGQLR